MAKAKKTAAKPADEKSADKTVKVKILQSMGGEYWSYRSGKIVDWREDEVDDLVKIGAVEIVKSDAQELCELALKLRVGIICADTTEVAGHADRLGVLRQSP